LAPDFAGDGLEYSFGIPQDVVVPEAQDGVAVLRHHARPRRISCGVLCMLPPIDFHDELGLTTAEVGYEIADRHLAPELRAEQSAVPKTAPEPGLRVGHRPT
jgi:hypothetical protein